MEKPVDALSPERILQLATGPWACAVAGAAATHRVFNFLEEGAGTAEAVARKAGISPRGAQALLDGLLGLGLVRLAGGRYENTPEASRFLVEGKPTCFGGFLKIQSKDMTVWSDLADVAKAGGPPEPPADEGEGNPFWAELVPAIAPLQAPVAQVAAERLGLPRAGAISILDVGGGSGIFSVVWLSANRQARSTQVDWANVNRIAQDFVGRAGVADRFRTIDGDYKKVDLGKDYDVIVYSHIAHVESPEENRAIFRRLSAALKPSGTLVINDFILNDDRTGHPFALLFHANMLLSTQGGATWRRADYQAWLGETGFKSVTFEPTPTPSTLIFAR